MQVTCVCVSPSSETRRKADMVGVGRNEIESRIENENRENAPLSNMNIFRGSQLQDFSLYKYYTLQRKRVMESHWGIFP